ncbi:hypothetical protein SG26_14375 [Haloarcula sp. CBA1115]|uniref:hypothetical protein n=1 Tax=unclassified Haloarcula TaxID=2624677 RepID=UPI0005955B99|nr:MULTISPECIES: hypothetical protein [unclassified Haloarcula]AJF26827.1 hypothetical protein SG26_14375 [Haloarcula sp. CBA1115]
MPHESTAELEDYAHSTVDEALRTIAILYEDGCEVVYIRDNLKGKYSKEEYYAVADTFREIPELTESKTEDAPLGSKQSLVHYHEEAYVFQFPHEQCHSILLSVDPTVGSRLKSFITGCQERL